MSTIEAEVLVPWEERTDPSGMVYRAPAIDGAVSDWEDVTGQDGEKIPPEPNLLLVCLRTDAENLANIRTDHRCHVVWEQDSQTVPENKSQSDAAERELLKQFMLRQGVASIEANSLIRERADRETKQELAARLKSWLKTRPARARI